MISICLFCSLSSSLPLPSFSFHFTRYLLPPWYSSRYSFHLDDNRENLFKLVDFTVVDWYSDMKWVCKWSDTGVQYITEDWTRYYYGRSECSGTRKKRSKNRHGRVRDEHRHDFGREHKQLNYTALCKVEWTMLKHR